MNKKYIKIYLLTILYILLNISIYAQPKIILKLDDLQAKAKLFNNALPVFDYLSNNSIKAGFGIMRMQNISDSQISDIINYLSKKDSNGEPLFEIWNHGLDHTRNNPEGTWEFSGTSYEYQKAHFDSANSLIKNKLGITAHTFGAPYNQIDTTFLRVMSEDKNMKVLLLGKLTPDKSTGINNLKNRVNMEIKTGFVNFDYFVKNYNSNKNKYKDYIVLQGHPVYWKADSFNQFKKVIEFLKSEGCQFVTPYAYYLSLKK